MAAVCLISTDNFAEEVVSGQNPVLILCMPNDDKFLSQLKLLGEIAERYSKNLKVCWIKESFLKTFTRNMGICGTPTFLLMLHGKEIDRMIGIADQKTIADFVTRSLRKLTEDQIITNMNEYSLIPSR